MKFAVEATVLRHSIEGNFNKMSVVEVEELVGGDSSGSV